MMETMHLLMDLLGLTLPFVNLLLLAWVALSLRHLDQNSRKNGATHHGH